VQPGFSSPYPEALGRRAEATPLSLNINAIFVCASRSQINRNFLWFLKPWDQKPEPNDSDFSTNWINSSHYFDALIFIWRTGFLTCAQTLWHTEMDWLEGKSIKYGSIRNNCNEWTKCIEQCRPCRYFVCKTEIQHILVRLSVKHIFYSRKCFLNAQLNTSCRNSASVCMAVLCTGALFALLLCLFIISFIIWFTPKSLKWSSADHMFCSVTYII
jgi:hypothetical protein